MLGEYGSAQARIDDTSSVVFIKHDLIEQQKLCITCSFGIDVLVLRALSLSDDISLAFIWAGEKPL